MMYEDWKAERQAAMDARTPTLLDAAYKRANLNDSFYYGLESQIEKRQQAKIPIAGEGAVAFFSGLTTTLQWGTKVAPFLTPLYLLSRTTEFVAREKSGL
jgi:hypothetical protein